MRPGDQVVEPVDRPEEGGLAAAGGPDDRRHRLTRDGEVEGLQDLALAVPELEPLHLDRGRPALPWTHRGSRSERRPGSRSEGRRWVHGRRHPNLPVMYASVCSLRGAVKIWRVGPV